jgi:choice-of-anchor B domain-containing protein
MKKLFTILILVFVANLSFAQKAYRSKNVTLLSNWDSPEVPATASSIGNRYSSCWGYAQKGREYAIVGAHTGVFVVDITNPAKPTKVAFVKGAKPNAIWREYKTYQNYLYCISDDSAPNLFQIIDLSYLPDSVHVVHNDNTIFERGHTIWVDGRTMYIATPKYKNGSSSSMAAFDLKDPAKPVLIRNINEDINFAPGAHDMFVKKDTCYMSGGYSGLYVYRLDEYNKFKPLGSLTTYPSSGYNHATMMLADNKHMVMLDEVPNSLPVKVINISNLSDIKTVATFSSGSNATPHNAFPAPNNRAMITYYEDGIQIFDFTNPAKPVKAGFFDTHYQTDSTNTTGGYVGVWSAYTELPSKNVIAVDMQNGLFVLDAKAAYGLKTNTQELDNQAIDVSPNPFSNEIKIKTDVKGLYNVTVFDLTGKEMFYEKNVDISQKTINTSNFPSGMYVLLIANETKMFSAKIVK